MGLNYLEWEYREIPYIYVYMRNDPVSRVFFNPRKTIIYGTFLIHHHIHRTLKGP